VAGVNLKLSRSMRIRGRSVRGRRLSCAMRWKLKITWYWQIRQGHKGS